MIWIGIDPGTKVTGVCVIMLDKKKSGIKLTQVAESVLPTPEFQANPVTRIAVIRNGVTTIARRYAEHVTRVAIEAPFGVQGNAIILHELVGAIQTGLIDVLGWDRADRIYKVAQPMVKKFAIGKNLPREQAIMDLSLRAEKEFNFKGKNFDEVVAFWLGLFAYHMDYESTVAFRKEAVERYKKAHSIE